jgi:Domain of unknown function (DUF4258)
MDVPPDPSSAVVRQLRMRPEKAQALIRSIAADTGKVIIGDHARCRMAEREISDIEVYRILQAGYVMEEPSQTEMKEWKCKIVKNVKGNREVGVVTVILKTGMLFAMTVEWEDL